MKNPITSELVRERINQFLSTQTTTSIYKESREISGSLAYPRTSAFLGLGIIPCPSWLRAYISMNDSAIERFVEQRRRAQQPLVGIASSHWRNVKRLRRTAAMSGRHCKE